eukprot:44602_1
MDDTTPNRRSKWDSYDVEEELRTIDKKTVEEGVLCNKMIKERERKETETRILKEARLAAGVLQSRAAVAALREKERRKCSRASTGASTLVPSDLMNMGTDRERKSSITDSSSEQVQILQSMASASKKRSSGMEKAFTSKNEAEFALKEGCLVDAIRLANDGLTVLDELLDVEKGQNERSDESKDSNCHRHCGYTMEHTEPKAKEDEFDAGQKVAIDSQEQLLVSARIDCQMIIGRALLQSDQLANATDYLRNILLEEPNCIDAWIERSRAFRLMGVPLLATLHSEQAVRKASATTRVPAFMKLTAEREQQLVDEAWETQDATSTGAWDGGIQKLPSFTRQSVCESFRRGIVLHREQFFQSARRCFQRTLDLVSECLSKGECDLKSDLHVVEQDCRLNIAACCILQQLDLHEAIERCTNALAREDEEGKHGRVNNQTIIKTFMTRAQAYEDTGSFKLALADLGSARMVIASWGEEEVELLARISAQEEHIRFVQIHYYVNEPDIQTAIQESSTAQKGGGGQ